MDWKQLLSDLKANGLTQAVIASRVNVAQSMVSDLATGVIKDPKFTTGQRLIDLHKKTMREASRKKTEA